MLYRHRIGATGRPNTSPGLPQPDISFTYCEDQEDIGFTISNIGDACATVLTVSTTGCGTETVSRSPPGIICGAECTESYVKGTVVTLTAHPGVNSYFIEWGGDCSGTGLTTTVTMDADKHCTATFGCPAGGIVMPVNKLGLVAPWMGVVALAGLAGLGVALVRRRRD